MAWYNPTDPTQRNWMLGGIVALVAIVPWQMYYLTPRHETNDTTLERVEGLEAQNQAAQVIAARGGGDLEQRMALYETHVAKLEELIPAQEEVAALINQITTRSQLIGVEVTQLDPEPAEQLQYYDRNSYAMSVVGEYHNVARFLTEIASLSRIVTPVQVDLQLFATPQQYPEMEFPVIAAFRIETYVLPDRSAQPAAEVGG